MSYAITPADFAFLEDNLDTKNLYGSDSSLTNIFLLTPKYNTRLFLQDKILLRYYSGNENRTGWAFPIPLKNAGDNYLKEAFSFMLNLSKEEGLSNSFCLFTQEEKNLFDTMLRNHFSARHIEWKTNRNDADYIYLQKNLAELSGSSFQKKRNHISRFMRIYGDDWTFKSFPENDLAEDILLLEEKWFNENNVSEDKALLLEKESISFALENAELFELTGGVLYIKNEAAAFTLASPVSDDTLDIHFEKALSEYGANGAYAVINNQFAKKSSSYIYLNREEDMGVEGLRKAKLSYKPDIILEKFYGKLF